LLATAPFATAEPRPIVKDPDAAEPAAEICMGSASLSACSTKPTSTPDATIHPTVPNTRMTGKSRVESVTWCSEMEFVSDSVGM
jgi:hypothetical protein